MPRQYTARVERTCAHCGATFFEKHSNVIRGKGIYCSMLCARAATKIRPVRRCLHCGTTFEPSVQQVKRNSGRYCSRPCYFAYKRAQSREHRQSWRYQEWRHAVYERDGYACQQCGDATGGNLHAHHVKPWANHPELRFDVNNGITLCGPCHKVMHPWMNLVEA